MHSCMMCMWSGPRRSLVGLGTVPWETGHPHRDDADVSAGRAPHAVVSQLRTYFLFYGKT